MDLSTITSVLWRHKVVTALIIVLTGAACLGVVMLVPPVYEVNGSYLLMRPPAPPTEAEIEAQPSLAKVRSDNPYLRFSDPSVVINVVARRVSTESSRERLASAGAMADFEVSPSARFGFASPIIDITAKATSEEETLATAKIVGDAVIAELRQVQKTEGVDDKYLISARPIEVPDRATTRSSGTMRALVGVFGVSGLVLVGAVAVLQAMDKRRTTRAARFGGRSRRTARQSRHLSADARFHSEEGVAATENSSEPRAEQSIEQVDDLARTQG